MKRRGTFSRPPTVGSGSWCIIQRRSSAIRPASLLQSLCLTLPRRGALLVAGRAGGKGEDLPNKLELLRTLGEARMAIIAEQDRVRPMGTTYHALSMVLSSIDALALFLTGNPIFFHSEPHRTP
jgi:hypothetical protein